MIAALITGCLCIINSAEVHLLPLVIRSSLLPLRGRFDLTCPEIVTLGEDWLIQGGSLRTVRTMTAAIRSDDLSERQRVITEFTTVFELFLLLGR